MSLGLVTCPGRVRSALLKCRVLGVKCVSASSFQEGVCVCLCLVMGVEPVHNSIFLSSTQVYS